MSRVVNFTDASQVSLGWIAVGGTTGYKIYRGTTPGGENVLVTTVTGEDTTSAFDTGDPTTPGSPPSINTAVVAGALNTVVQGNFIGTNPTGSTAIGNGAMGLAIVQAASLSVGGANAGEGNIISGNRGDGVFISGSSSTANVLVDNFIGTDVTGALAIGNGGNGIEVTNGANQNTLGGIAPVGSITNPPPPPGKPTDGNLISANGGDGVLLNNGATSNILSGNFIGTTLSGLTGLGNSGDGVAILNGSNSNTLSGAVFPEHPFIYLNLVCAQRQQRAAHRQLQR